jgi:hypothetical protein
LLLLLMLSRSKKTIQFDYYNAEEFLYLPLLDNETNERNSVPFLVFYILSFGKVILIIINCNYDNIFGY